MASPPRATVADPPRWGLDPAALERMAQVCAHRLRYAHFKVQNGWAKQTLAEVENLYYQQHSHTPPPTTDSSAGDVFGSYALVTPRSSHPEQENHEPQNDKQSSLSRTKPCFTTQFHQNRVLTNSSAPMSNRVLENKPTYYPEASSQKQNENAPENVEGVDNMTLLAQASLMAPPASTPLPARKANINTSLCTPPRRMAPPPTVDLAFTPTPAEFGFKTPGAMGTPAWSNFSSTPMTSAFAAPPKPRVGGDESFDGVGRSTPSALPAREGEFQTPNNYASFWAHVGSMGGLGSSTPATGSRKRFARPSMPSTEGGEEGSLKRLRVAGI